jgi:hypothetical protein
MNRSIGLYVIVLFLLPSDVFSQAFDVAKAYWGMSPLDVQLSEGKPPDWRGPDGTGRPLYQLMYKDRIHGSVGFIYFSFSRNKLVEVYYTASFRGNAYDVYSTIKGYVSEKRGRPISIQEPTKNQKAFRTEWVHDDRTHVELLLFTKKSEYGWQSLFATYTDLEYYKTIQKKR